MREPAHWRGAARAARRREARERNRWWAAANQKAEPFRMRIARMLDATKEALAAKIRRRLLPEPRGRRVA